MKFDFRPGFACVFRRLSRSRRKNLRLGKVKFNRSKLARKSKRFDLKLGKI